MNTIQNRRSRQRGYSLAEILVAVTIFTVVILAALTLYDRSNKVFKSSVEASDMQQSTRVAFDKVVADLRMSGFDFDRDGTPFGSLSATWKAETTYTQGMLVQPTNPNGHTYVVTSGGKSSLTEPTWPTGSNEQVAEASGLTWQEDGTVQYQQPDEQIEYAGAHAVAIRANFNYDTATGPCDASQKPCENGREPKLQSTPFPLVTTANNEIVIYALKPVKWASGESADDLVFYADTSIPRSVNPGTDKKENKITITGVDLCDNGGCNSPPYTLYRYTIQDDGTPDAGTPVADNIRTMNFSYFTTTNAATTDKIATVPNGDGQYDGAKPDDTVTGRDTRATIRAIEVALTGMNAQKDKNYTDTTDAVAPNYRKLALKSLVVPRNMGRRGMKEYSTEAPGTPTMKSICSGSCNAVFATWTAPTTGGDIDSYAVVYDTDPSDGFQYSEEVGLNLTGSVGRFITPGQNWYFAVQAINKWGSTQSNTMGPIMVLNKTQPKPLDDLQATHPSNAKFPVQENQVSLYFPPAISNLAGQDALTCLGGGSFTQSEMPPSERRFYEIYRGTSATFDPATAGASVLVLDAGSAIQPVADGGLMRWTDTTTANCTTYYYRIRVVDFCARNAAWNSPAQASQGQSAFYPAVGKDAIAGQAVNYTKPEEPVLTLSKEDCAGNSSNCELTFTWGAVNKNTDGDPITVSKYTLYVYEFDAVAGKYPATPTDKKVLTNGELTTTYNVSTTDLNKFVLSALDCNESDMSNEIIYPCTFTGGALKVDLPSGDFGGSGTSADPFIVEQPTLAVTTTLPVKEIRVSVFLVSSGAQVGTTQSQGGPTSSATFTLPETTDSQLSRVLVTAVDTGGCAKTNEFYMIDQPAPICSLTDTGTDSNLVTVNKDNVVFTLDNNDVNNALSIKKLVVKFNAAEAKTLSSVSFNGTLVTVNCNKGTAVVTAPSGATVPKNSATYKLTMNVTAGNLQGNNPFTSLCVIYQATTGDIVSCQMHPTAGACTEPSGAACQ